MNMYFVLNRKHLNLIFC